MNQVIVSAIRDRKIIAFGTGSGARKVEPHAYGLDYVGKGQLLCYDVSASGTAGRRGWTLLPVHPHADVSATLETFERPRSGYRRDDTGLCSVVAQV